MTAEQLNQLADAILADRDAPLILVLAAFAAKNGSDAALRDLAAEAALEPKETA